jgi:potassium channel LctB
VKKVTLERTVSAIEQPIFARPWLILAGLAILTIVFGVLHWYVLAAICIYAGIATVVVWILRLLYLYTQMLLFPKNWTVFLIGYFFSIMLILLLFAMVYSFSDASHTGQLSYGNCSATTYNPAMSSSLHLFPDYLYFSAVTFFTVGYGDMCPTGNAKYVAIANMWLGHFFTVIILAIAVAIVLPKVQKTLKKRDRRSK